MRLEDLHVDQRVMVVSDTLHEGRLYLHEVDVHRIYHPDTGAVNIRVCVLDGSGQCFAGFQPEDLDYP